MGISIENITTQNDYVPANTFGQGTPMVAGWFIVANAVCSVQLTTGLHGQPSKQEEVSCPPGIYPIQSNPKNPITTIAFRSFVAGTPAQIIGAVFYPADSFIQSGGSFDSQISSGGGVTPPGSSLLTGEISAAGAITQGTGFTVAHPGVGIYDITFTTPFSAAPAAFITPIDTNLRIPHLDPAFQAAGSIRIVMLDSAGTPQNTRFCFSAQGIS